MRAALEASLSSGGGTRVEEDVSSRPSNPSIILEVNASNTVPQDEEMRAVLAASFAASEEQRKIDENIARLMGIGPQSDEQAGNSSEDRQRMRPPDLFEQDTCPICTEDLDETDRSFIPCPCGYQLCLFCYKKIQEDKSGQAGAGLCPGCRKPLSEPKQKQTPKPRQGGKRRP